MKKYNLIAILLLFCGYQPVWGAISTQEAAQLGATLTHVGAEIAGNAEGTIPEWDTSLKLISSDPVYVTNPLAAEAPDFSISQDNMAEYADKLSEGSKQLLNKYPGYRMDIYPTIRSAIAPDFIYQNSKINAISTTLINDGLTLKKWKPGVPFPIPQNGLEAIWNHLVRWIGKNSEATSTVVYVNRKGNAVEASTQFVSYSSPAYSGPSDENAEEKEFLLFRANFISPARRAGEMTLVRDPTDFSKGQGRKAWQYLMGQRRVRRAPSIGFDTPATATAGNSTYDDLWIYNGSPERYDWKLIGKKELFVPYNNWQLTNLEGREQTFTPEFFNPDFVRWELHRVWIVEASLKEGLRHLYKKRRYYLDEDSWVALMGDLYDNRDQFWRTNFTYFAHDYMSRSFINTGGSIMYDLNSGIYNTAFAKPYTITSQKKPKKEKYYTSSGLSRSGVR